MYHAGLGAGSSAFTTCLSFSRFVILWSEIAIVDVLCSSAVTVGCSTPAAPRTIKYDYSKPNPININGSYKVTLVLVNDKTNTLASEEGMPLPDRKDLRCGSGRAALRMPTGATLTKNVKSQFLCSGCWLF